MRQSKHQWYKDGANSGKPASITFDFKRIDGKFIKRLTEAQRKELKEWIYDYVRPSFKGFLEEIDTLLKME